MRADLDQCPCPAEDCMLAWLHHSILQLAQILKIKPSYETISYIIIIINVFENSLKVLLEKNALLTCVNFTV